MFSHPFLIVFAALLFHSAGAAYDEDSVYSHIFHNYNPFVLPECVRNNSRVVVEFGLSMILLVNVDEKNQILQTNVWLTLSWNDPRLRWNPADYNMLDEIRAPVDKIWLPDIVLLNNADGNYEVSYHSNAKVEHDGTVLWVPPAIYKSSCTIDVHDFPFDEQTCLLVFSSWTYSKDEVQLAWHKDRNFIGLEHYSYSSIWDVVAVPGSLQDSDSKLTFYVKIRRKPLFYTVLLIIPTVLLAYLNVFVFHIPAAASEKIVLAVNLLLAMVVFVLLLSKILPSNSNALPFVAKYLLLTFVLEICAIIMTVVVLNVYFRRPCRSPLPSWVRQLFLVHMPRMLLMERPILRQEIRPNHATVPSYDCASLGHNWDLSGIQVCEIDEEIRKRTFNQSDKGGTGTTGGDPSGHRRSLFLRAMISTDNIFNYLVHLHNDQIVREEWQYVSQVLDRFLLFLFFGVTLGGTLNVITYLPSLFDRLDQRELIERIYANKEQS